MAKKTTSSSSRRKRSTSPLNDLPGLFDNIDIDIAADDLAGDVIATHERHVSRQADSQDFAIDIAKLQRPSSLRFISFGSGSSGNCYYLGIDSGEGKSTGVLIDAGVEPDCVYKALRDNKIDIHTISGILLTHDHGDHVKYAYTLLRANKHMVLYTTMRTMSGILRRHNISRRIKDYHKIIYKEFEFDAGGFKVTAFETSHDGTENVGYAINTPDGIHHFVIATDTGKITDRADFYLRMANYIVIESNYDLRMLMTGRYPEYLKARIVGEHGHLDNTVASDYIKSIVSPALSHVFLCHLSEENNTPEIALENMQKALVEKGLRIGNPANPLMAADTDIAVGVLPRTGVSPQFLLRHKNV